MHSPSMLCTPGMATEKWKSVYREGLVTVVDSIAEFNYREE